MRFDDDIDFDDLLVFAQAWSELGHAVQEQLEALLDGDYSDLNPNAVDLIERKLGGFHDEIEDAVRDYRKALKMPDLTRSD